MLLSGQTESELELVSDEIAKLRKLKGYPKGTILFAKSGMSATKDRIYVLQNPAHVVSHLATLIPNGSAHADYLRLALKGFPPSVLIKDPAYPSISLGDIQSYEIPVPDQLEDQIRIAHLLGKVEGLIAQRKQHLHQLDDLLKSVFLGMFGDPVQNAMGWDRLPLEKLGSLNRGVSKHRPRNASELLGGKYPLIQTGEVSNAGTYITSFSHTYSELGFAQSKLWPQGTLCITIAANIAQTAILSFDACFPDSVVAFSAFENEADVLYVHGLFWFFQKILEKNAPAAAQKNINLKILRGMEVPKPPIELQAQFASAADRIEGIKSHYQQSLTDLEALYGALSQQAFKGELDLSRVALPEIGRDQETLHMESFDRVIEPASTGTKLSLPELPKDYSLSGKKRHEALRHWLDYALKMQQAGAIFEPSALVDAVNFRLEIMDDDHAFDSEDNDTFRDWLFEALQAGRLEQVVNIVGTDSEGNPITGNIVQLMKAQVLA